MYRTECLPAHDRCREPPPTRDRTLLHDHTLAQQYEAPNTSKGVANLLTATM